MDTSFTKLAPGAHNLITDVGGLSVGNAGDAAVVSGTTVILAERPVVAAVDIRGGAPGTRETDALDPAAIGGLIDALVLSGGSVYGLDAASAITAALGAQGRGFALRPGVPKAPIVPAAILFDLANGGDKDWGAEPPYAALGREALAGAGTDFALGNSGAGLGALAGIYKGGLGSASIAEASGLVVGALVAVNAVGSAVVPGTDAFWAAPFEVGAEFGGRAASQEKIATLPPLADSKLARAPADAPVNTTIAVVATNADLSRVEARRLAIMAHDGLARALRPVHTPFDGDTVFALATGKVALPEPRPRYITALGSLAADTLARAVARGVWEAETIAGIESYRERHPS